MTHRRSGDEPAHVTRRPFALPASRPHYAPDRRARVDHIALTLAFDFKRKILKGRCATTFTAIGGPLSALDLQAGRMSIKGVRGFGKALAYELVGQELRIELPRLATGKSATVTVDYEVRRPQQGLYFIAPDKDYPDKPYQAWTQSQDADAHYWFPCIDHPNAKATTAVTATVPSDFFVLSNGTLVSTTTDATKKTKTYRWKMDVPHVTYLVSVVAGKFVGRTDKAGAIPVSWYVEPGREADGKRSFGKTPKMVAFFGERIGVKYPYSQYSQIAVRDFVFGGMENTTCTTQTDATLHDARAALDFSSDGLVAHELAHQWFGDLLTCKDWSHAWLNESFATYFDALFKEHDLGEAEFAYQRILDQDLYLKEDAEHYRRPIVTNVYAEPVDLFDRHLYEKGSCVLHMLRVQLGDELWWKAINDYVSTNAQGSVETVDLARALERVSGRNFARFFDQWIFGAGHPEFAVAYRWDADAKSAIIDIRQTQQPEENTASVFALPAVLEFGLARGKRHTVAVDIDTREHSIRVPLPARPETFVFDPRADVLKTVKLDVPVEMLLRQLAAHAEVGARVAAARALAGNASPEAIDGLRGALKRDAFWGVQAEAAKALGAIKTDDARAALIAAVKVANPKARRAVAEALGEFRGEQACAALEPLAKSDRSYFVEAAAATSIGKTKSPRAFELLRKSLDKDSFNDVVRAGALTGYGALGDERAIPALLDWTKYGHSSSTRRAAIQALARLGERRKDVVDALIGLLDDPQLRVRINAADALGKMNAVDALPELDRLANLDVEGRLRIVSMEAAQKIRAGKEPADELRRLRDDVDQLRAANAKLEAKLAEFEPAPVRPNGARSKARR
ncbi:MAG: HEAT repeat domain-containing protein [Candidatus Eremiobacteraeota bacterium]|nr:HEAT repeat domain-containing protein [Candidatus Eremiobacteraeota bacterium]